MATVVAIDISSTQALLLAAETLASGTLKVLALRRLSLDALSTQTAKQNGTSEAIRDGTALESAEHPQRSDLEEMLGFEIDSSLLVLSRPLVLYEDLVLPFRDAKKIERVAPLQIQDLVPFELDDFVVDTTVMGKNESGDYRILSSLVPAARIKDALDRASLFGIDPKIISSPAASLTSLPTVERDTLRGTFAVVAAGSRLCSMALYHDDDLSGLREIPFVRDDSQGRLPPELLGSIRCSLARLAKETGVPSPPVFFIGRVQDLNQLERELGTDVRPVRLPLSAAEGVDGLEDFLGESPWIFGLLASELKSGSLASTKLIDFRKGPFAYKPLWQSFRLALKEELFYVVMAIICAVAWAGSLLYEAHALVNGVETAIETAVASALGAEKIPPRREVDYLQQKVQDLEQQLRDMGTLSSLTPLDSLKELSEINVPGIDLSIQSVSIGYSLMSFHGSVSDEAALGRMIESLEGKKDRFCQVKVDTPGKVPGSSRVKFTGEIKLCE